MKLQTPKILFFVAGYAPTAADLMTALDLGVGVQYRNSTKIAAEDPCEPCDGVAGDVPSKYAERYADAVDVVAEYRASLEAARDRMGETAAPRDTTRTKPPVGKPAPKTAAAKTAAAPAKQAWGGKPAPVATPAVVETPTETVTEGAEGAGTDETSGTDNTGE